MNYLTLTLTWEYTMGLKLQIWEQVIPWESILFARPKDWVYAVYPSFDQATIGDGSTLDAKKWHLVGAKNDQVFC